MKRTKAHGKYGSRKEGERPGKWTAGEVKYIEKKFEEGGIERAFTQSLKDFRELKYLEQWCVHSPPTNMALVHFPDSAS